MTATMEIERFPKLARSEAVDVLRASFFDYPVMRHVLQGSGDNYGEHLDALVGYYCDRRFTRDWPVLGARVDGEGVAITVLNEPVYKPPPPELVRAEQRLQRTIGDAAYARMQEFEQASDLGEPDYPHYFVGMLGVHPEHQGRGHAAALLEHIHELSASAPTSMAVCLSTEDPSNLPFYEKHGYSIVSEADLGELRTWSLALPTP